MCWRRIAPRALGILPRAERARLRPVSADGIPALAACYAEVARGTNGFLERPSGWWRAARDHLWRGRSVFAAEGADARITGYVVYRPLEGEYSALGGPFRLALD